MTDWRPIETAPTDGARVIGFDSHQWEGDQICTTYRGNSGKWIFEAEIEAVGWEDYQHAHWDPTHWMPLPAPPNTDCVD